MHSRVLVLAVFLTILLSGCATISHHSNSSEMCSKGHTCRIGGILHVYRATPAWAFVIHNKTGCIKLALPRDAYALVNSWDGSKVFVSGLAFEQPATDVQGTVALSFTWKGREMAFGVCDYGLAIYADRLENAQGQVIDLKK